MMALQNRIKLRYVAGIAGILALVVLGVMVLGIPTFESSGTCTESVALCHGLPLGENCLGTETFQTRPVPENDCGLIENITARCNAAADRICEINDRSIGLTWAEKTQAFGLKCSEWNREYDLDLRSC